MSLEVSLEGVQVRLRGTQEDLMSFPLVRISFVADTNDLLVVMAIKDSTGTPTSKLAPPLSGGVQLVKMGCHVFQSANVSCVALGSARHSPLAALSTLLDVYQGIQVFWYKRNALCAAVPEAV